MLNKIYGHQYYFIILILMIIIIFGIIRFKYKESFLSNTPRVKILVISKNEKVMDEKVLKERWYQEKSIWLNKFNPLPNINFELIECGKPYYNLSHVKNYNCQESFRPGIFQKTILSLKDNINQYDFFVRTNLNAFIIQSKLMDFINKHRHNQKLYEGVTGDYTSWVGGWGIILSNYACRVLIAEGQKKNYFYDSETPDDVLIGNILKSKNIVCKHFGYYLGYVWNNSISIEQNLKIINNNPNYIFIRVRNQKNLDDSKRLISLLYEKYR